MKAIIIAALAVLVIGGGGFALFHKSNKPITPTTTSNTSTTTQNNSSSNSNTQTPASAENTITYTDNGFSPSTLTVKAGATVTIKNNSSRAMQFDSDPHPVHTDDTELNVGTVAPGQSQSFTVNKTGSHGYHNHLNPSDTGTLVVE